MSQPKDIETEVILATVESLGAGELPGIDPSRVSAGGEPDDATETLTRLYTEVWGLIPYELAAEAEVADPVARSIKQRVLAGIGAVEADKSTTSLVTEHPRFASRRAAETPAAVAAEATPLAGRSFRNKLVALAAMLAFLLIGLGAFSAWLFVELGDQRAIIAQMSQELDQAGGSNNSPALASRELVGALRNLSVLGPDEVEVCPLRPVGETPLQPQARGMLFLVDDKGRWHLQIRDLAPAPPEQVYQLWFFDGDRPVQKVSLDPGPSGEIELTSYDLPALMDAVAITLESSTEVERPTGPRILYGHSREMDRL